MNDEASAEPKRPPVLALVLIVLAIVLLVVFREPVFGFFGDHERVRAGVERLGRWGPAALIALTAVQVLVAPIPGQFAGMASGYLFGTALGTFYAMVGLVLGTAAAMALARRLGRPWVKRFVDEARLERWDHVARRWGPALFFVAFLLPGLPDDLLCFVIGLSRLPLVPMLALVTIGRFPGMVGASYLGANAGEMPEWVWPVAIALGAAASVAIFAFGDRIEELSLAIGRRLGRHR